MYYKMQLFWELLFKEYKTKTESIDNDIKDTKTSSYTLKSNSNSWLTTQSKKGKESSLTLTTIVVSILILIATTTTKNHISYS
jgi:hypothetical protein